MKKIFRQISLTLLFLALATALRAQENQTEPEKTAQPQLKWTYGTVSQVAFAKAFLVVTTDQGYITFSVTDDTTIMIGPKKVGLEDIQTEDSVRVQYYIPEPGKYVAVTIGESKKEGW